MTAAAVRFTWAKTEPVLFQGSPSASQDPAQEQQQQAQGAGFAPQPRPAANRPAVRVRRPGVALGGAAPPLAPQQAAQPQAEPLEATQEPPKSATLTFGTPGKRSSLSAVHSALPVPICRVALRLWFILWPLD
jgi:hypothetical protein